jgi:branched-chain amino acid transport system ATP-binding protein
MLSVENITVKIKAYTILRGLTIEVPTDSIVALVGRNGAGKTTTMRSIMGLVSMTEGKIRLNDHNLGPLPPHQRAKLGIGYLPEDRKLINGLTVEQNLMMPAQAVDLPAAEPRLKTIYSLLPEIMVLAARKAMQLSGGQQKLVALGRSFMNAKKLLLLDEPFEGISMALCRKLAEVIHEFQRAYVIERGEVVEESSIG